MTIKDITKIVDLVRAENDFNLAEFNNADDLLAVVNVDTILYLDTYIQADGGECKRHYRQLTTSDKVAKEIHDFINCPLNKARLS